MKELTSFAAPQSAAGSYLLSFEGIEGAGKTTQIQKCKTWLESQGKVVHLFREPGATALGEALRAIILGQKTPLHPLTEALIFAAARVELIQTKLLPLLKRPQHIVLLDRFIDSSLAYQGVARELGIPSIMQLHQLPPLNIFPHLTFYLQIDIPTSMQRQQERGHGRDYFEQENLEFHSRLKHGFDELSELWPTRIKTIDAKKDPEQVFAQLKQHLQQEIK